MPDIRPLVPIRSPLLARRVDKYIAREMYEPEIVELFQELIDAGVVWKMGPHWTESALFLIARDHCFLLSRGTC